MTLRMLVFSDVHGDMGALNTIDLSKQKYDPDLFVMCGDITHFGDLSWAVSFFEKINGDLIGVTGNCDPESIKKAYDSVGGDYLHHNIVSRKGIKFTGLSGSKYSEDSVKRFNKYANRADIFVLHSPPYGYLDKTNRGKHIGERSLLRVIDKNEPLLVLSGHVHEDRGIIRDGPTSYVNPGAASENNLAIVEIDESKVKAKLI
ncbi:MAG: metallophosphoesterase family protein [Thermoplasmatota archaeon]